MKCVKIFVKIETQNRITQFGDGGDSRRVAKALSAQIEAVVVVVILEEILVISLEGVVHKVC